jgi:branched-chain amino acid transport system substrate-binding protein
MKKCACMLILILLVLSSFSLVGCGQTSSTIKIGVLQPLSGNVAYWGSNALMGAQMAADEINDAGGINGKQIEIVKMDTAGDKAQAMAGIKKLTGQGVAAIIGPVTSGETFAVGPIANESQVVFISPGATADKIGDIGPFVFRNTLNDSVGAPLTVGYVIEKYGFKKVALLFSNNNDYSVGLKQIWADALGKTSGVQILGEVSYSDGDTDFSAQVTSLKNLAPDAVFVSGDGVLDETLFKLAGDAANGVILYTGYSPENPADYAQKFLADFKAQYEKEPQINSAQAYDAMKIIAEAIKQAGPEDKDGIRQAITEIKDFPGVSGVTTFNDQDGNAVKPAFLLEIKDGKFELLDILENK